ncbi:MAG: hypothetical protein IIA60_04890 [Candidatus Marinimicrobia bacterium]|nr:hypothetical protein [Candidatus Neomarinimicrobiota bacterium]
MKNRTPYTLLGLVILICLFLGYTIYSLPMAANISPLLFIDVISFGIVILPAFALYYGAFITTGNKRIKLQGFKLRWLQEVLLALGIIGTLIGITFIAAVVTTMKDMDRFNPMVGSGLAVSLITIFYGFIPALGLYFIEKRLIATKKDEIFEPHSVKSGFSLRSIVGLWFVLGLLFGVINLLGIDVGKNPMPMFFNLPVLGLIITSLLISVFIYGGQATIQALRVPFWRVNENEETLLSTLNAIRGNKRIIALLGLLLGLVTIIIGLKILGAATEAFIVLVNYSSILSWCLLLILFLNLAEGQIVQQIYLQTGEIHYEDRFFIAKFILPSFFFLYFLLLLDLIFLFIA